MRDHRDLVRDGAVEAGKAHRPRPTDGIGQIRGIHLDGQITPIQTVMAIRCLDHHLRRVLRDRLAETCRKLLLEVQHGEMFS